MRVPDLEEMVSAVEREVGYYAPRLEALEMVQLMIGQYTGSGTIRSGTVPKYEFERIVGLALNANDTEGEDLGRRVKRQAGTVNAILSHYVVTEEDARLANDRDKKDHIRVEGVLAALQAEIDCPGDWTDRSE